MHHTPDPSSANPGPTKAALVSLSRRQLLRAAASSAPLIATLPSGAAMAQASVFQCLAEVGNATPPNVIPGGDLALGDGFIRVAGIEYTYSNALGADVLAYQFTYRGSTVKVMANGNEFNGSGLTLQSERNVQLLVLYGGLDDPLTSADPNCQIRSGITGWTPTSPNNCVWPVAQVQTTRPGNIAMTTSCWCSVSPGDLPPDVCKK